MFPVAQSRESERGAVIVLVAIALPVLVLFVSLAVDFAHFFDYSRNLQARADAAALAAGVEYGSKCFGATVSPAQLDAIGQAAQQYAGPPNGTPPNAGNPAQNLPFAFNAVTPYYNQPKLKAGSPTDFYMILNGSTSADKGGTNFSDGTVCAADYPVTPGPPPAPATDVWLTQEHVPLFFPLLGIKPNISAHARVQLQAIGQPVDSTPIAVPDPADVPCMVGNVVDQTTGAVIATTGKLTETNTNPPTWSGPTTTGVTVPSTGGAADQLAVQAFFPDDCSNINGSGTRYDAAAQGGGIDFINGYTTPPATVTTPTIGSVWLEAAGCNPTGTAESTNQTGTAGNAYFYYFTTSTACKVIVHARVDFPAGQGAPGVVAVMDGDVANGQDMHGPPDLQGNNFWYSQTFAIPPLSGRHVFTLRWYQSASTVQTKCKTLADATNKTKPCDLNGGNPVQQTFAAVDDGSDPPDDSGPIIGAYVGCSANCTAVGGVAPGGINTIPTGTNPTLQITFQLQGLKNSGQNDPPVVLRASVQSSKATGLVDCGQGNGASSDSQAIQTGCPHSVAVYNGNTCIVDPSAQPWTCLSVITGNRRQQIVNGFVNKVGQSCDNWQSYKATGVNNINADTDPRAFVMIITSPNDLSLASSNPNAIIHILGFAVFYVTGWDGDKWAPGQGNQTIPGCTAPTDRDEAFPGTGSSNNQIWGHFFKTVVPGIGGGIACDPNAFGGCVAALTR
jgi:hypothetical protein